MTHRYEIDQCVNRWMSLLRCNTSASLNFPRERPLRPLENMAKPIADHNALDHASGMPISNKLSSFHQEYMKYILKAHSLWGANPNKPSQVALHNQLFVGNVTPIKEAIATEMTALEKGHSSSPILIIGGRGCGKSTILNQYLNTENDTLNKARYIWMRCDAHKLYMLWDQFKKPDLSIKDYLKIQMAYVVTKYSEVLVQKKCNKDVVVHERNDVFAQAVAALSTREIPQVNNKFNPIKKMGKDVFESFLAKIRRENPDNPWDSAVIEIASNALHERTQSRIEFTNIRMLSDTIRNYFSQELNPHFRFLFIVDGVDNVQYDKAEEKTNYKTMVQHLAHIQPRSDEIWLVSVRPETYQELGKLDGDHLPPLLDSLTRIPLIMGNKDFQTPGLDEILRRKREVEKNPPAGRLQEMRNDLEKSALASNVSIEALDNDLDTLGNDYVSMLGKLIRNPEDDFSGTDGMEDSRVVEDVSQAELHSLVNEAFRFNVRSIILNLLSLFQIKLINTYNGEQWDMERWLRRNLFLNGLDIKDTSSSAGGNRHDGYVLPTLTWYDGTKAGLSQLSHWHGLCGLRIIQTTHFLKNAATEYRVIEEVRRLFHYDEAIIKHVYDHLIQHRLLYYSIRRLSAAPAPQDIQLEVSKRGWLAVGLIFNHLDILYYLALDTPLVMGDQVPRHNNKPRYHQGGSAFVGPMLSTGMWLIRHITCWHQWEMIEAHKVCKQDRDDLKNKTFETPWWRSENEFDQHYQLPYSFPNEKIGKDMKRMLQSLLKDEEAWVRNILVAPLPDTQPLQLRDVPAAVEIRGG
ncbi:MAG: hypothetical protein HQL95_08095 [Magnetococcales bacterium]|nr:hypothetical protein [Magnetococcales bacterium]